MTWCISYTQIHALVVSFNKETVQRNKPHVEWLCGSDTIVYKCYVDLFTHLVTSINLQDMDFVVIGYVAITYKL